MSGNLAIAAVSAVMKYLLQNPAASDSIAAVVPNLAVTAVAPQHVGDDAPHINIFFYRAMVNTGWAQSGLPARNSQGARVNNPALALDLCYMISAHASQDFFGEILLGYAMQTFHENPVLTRKTIRDALTSSSLVTTDTPEELLAAIATTELAEQIEQIRLAPHYPAADEAANLWTGIHADYAPTAYYRASVVLIESQRSARAAPPVRDYRVYALPFQQIRVDDVVAEAGAGQPILAGQRVLVRGSSLRGEDTRVVVGDAELSGAALTVSSSQIALALPAGLKAGIVGLQVVHRLSLGDPPQPHQGFESNVAALVLQPQVRKTGPSYEIQVVAAAGDEPRKLRVTLEPAVGPEQRATLLLNERGAAVEARSFTFDAEKRDPDDPPASQLTFPIPGVPAGSYLVRVRVSGAESPLVFTDAGGYVEPAVTL
jgi:hypothetical protein